MKVSHLETETVEREVVTDIICNKCGNSCKNEDDNCFGLIETQVQGGYAAKLGDMVTWTFSICEDCLKELFDSFKVPVERSKAWYEREAEELEKLEGEAQQAEVGNSPSGEHAQGRPDEESPGT